MSLLDPAIAYLSPNRLAAALCTALLLTPPCNAQTPSASPSTGSFVGFDRNTFPGDAALPTLRRHFSFIGYWLNTPPGAATNSWLGKRSNIAQAGFGFLVLWNGRLDAQIKSQAKARPGHPATLPESLGRSDAAAAVTAAQREHFPPGTILFLDQEEGGRLLPEQAAYLLAWTEAVAKAGFRPGVYASGQPVPDDPIPGGPGPNGHPRTITTADDITARVREQHLHPVALWVAQDACGPSTGCTLTPPAFSQSGTANALVWQYAQSPRRPEITHSCARTYNAAGNCTAPDLPALFLDLNVSNSADPSHGR